MRTAICIVAITIAACGITPKQAGDDAQLACTLVEAFTDSPTVDSVCATAPELVTLTTAAVEARAAAQEARAVAGSRYAAPCRRIPGTETCATEAEIATGIRAVKAKRAR